ncbi:MAG: PqqD family peptide modification chaperone [Planctomycetaceae bacterium]
MQPIARTDDLHVEEVGDELVVFDHRTHAAHALNAAAAFVWERCDGEHSLEQIEVDARAHDLPTDAVRQAIQLLHDRQLLTVGPRQSGEQSRGLTRRMLTRAAVAAVVPAIVSMAAPANALGVVSGPNGGGRGEIFSF